MRAEGSREEAREPQDAARSPRPRLLPQRPSALLARPRPTQASPFLFSVLMWVRLKMVRNFLFSSKLGLLFISSGL